jgi:hypothetical protein
MRCGSPLATASSTCLRVKRSSAEETAAITLSAEV